MKATYRPADMDAMTRSVTALIVTATIVLPLAAAWMLPKEEDRIGLLWTGGVFAVLILIAWVLRPVRYELDDAVVSIVRNWPVRNVTVPMASVTDVSRITLSAWKQRGWLTISGLFGTFGWCYNRDIGGYFITSTNGHRNVLVSGNRKLVISPEKPEEFIEDVKARIRSART